MLLIKRAYMIIGNKYRITILTGRLIRLEYNEQGIFEDRITKTVVNRDFDKVPYELRRFGDQIETGKKENSQIQNDPVENSLIKTIDTNNILSEFIEIETDDLIIRYDEKNFSAQGLSITLKETGSVWHYSITYGNSDENLFGTARTLDGCDGGLWLEEGIFGKRGYAVLNDTGSPVVVSGIDDNPSSYEYANRDGSGIDIYFFGYGKDFYGGLRDFYKLCGKTPMIPRYALGNWWSRYYRYTEESYSDVLDNFKKMEIPLSVAVIDMDWHITEVDPRYGTGWTGYSWNKDLFPDHKRFLKMLHDRGLATTLNLHPADGIRAFEDMYREVAESVGIDPDSKEPVEFDFSDKKFRDAYFEKVMHPYEDDGVDFWWIDWQQGTGRDERDVDPLFLLNHYHYHDQEGRNIRPMIFSRYAGPGSHRYPVGFSGDTVMTWKSLDFQPYFTSTSSNIGYGYWSHDIGGHMMGDKDDERLIRWIQYGVFSPINRLHSSSSAFLNKEPWAIDEPYRGVMTDYLRLRHRLLPYLYTESFRAYEEDKPIVRPMYYLLPDDERAYNVPCEYGFGDELIVGAITRPMDRELRLSTVNMVLPSGRWYDIFTGTIYNGDIMRKMYRRLTDIPVLLGEGGIIPMSLDDKTNGVVNPTDIRLCIGFGQNGSYEMYEDDGITMNYLSGSYVKTRYETEVDQDTLHITIAPARGDLSLIPDKRKYEISIYGAEVSDLDNIVIKDISDITDDNDTENNDIDNDDTVKNNTVNNNTKDSDAINDCTKTSGSEDDGILKPEAVSYDNSRRILNITIGSIATSKGAVVTVSGIHKATNDYKKKVFDILEYAWIPIMTKDLVNGKLQNMSDDEFLNWLKEADISENLKNAITEIYADK